MKANKRTLIVALVFVAVAMVFGSCAKKTCPAYSKANTAQVEQNG
jgi:hypothetical protein